MKSKEDSMNFKLETALKEDFKRACKYNHRPASQVIRDLMREYIEKKGEKKK